MSSSLLGAARELLEANTEVGTKDGRRYRYTLPSRGRYPFQWFWDSCFHAVVWARLDPERAKDEIRSLLAWQEPDGFIPHVLFWNQARVRRVPWHWHWLESRMTRVVHPFAAKPHTTLHMQPPVLAVAVERIVARAPEFLAETLPALEAYYRWLARARDPDGDGLVSIIAQFESGLDFSPAYDEAIGAVRSAPLMLELRSRWPELQNKLVFGHDAGRIFRRGRYHQEDVLVNAVYADNLGSLARLADSAGRSDLADWARERRAAAVESLLVKCWDPAPGLFWNLVGGKETRNSVPTVIALMPLVLEELPAPVVERLLEHLLDPEEFWTPYPVAAVSRAEPTFVPGIHVRGRRLIWRGPMSMNTNWLIAQGLRRHGYGEAAETIAERSREAVERGGFNEFYNPLTGEPVGEPRFGWATLVVDL